MFIRTNPCGGKFDIQSLKICLLDLIQTVDHKNLTKFLDECIISSNFECENLLKTPGKLMLTILIDHASSYMRIGYCEMLKRERYFYIVAHEIQLTVQKNAWYLSSTWTWRLTQ